MNLNFIKLEYSYILLPGHLAQLGAHFLDVEGVRGSSPLVPTRNKPSSDGLFSCAQVLRDSNKEGGTKCRKEKPRWGLDADAA